MNRKRPYDGRDERGRTTALPPALRAHVFRKGEIHNPAGKGGKYQECKRLCREASPKAAKAIIQMIDQTDDDRVRFIAASWVHEQAWGKPKDFDPAAEKPEQRLTFDPRRYTPKDVAVIEQGLRLMLAGGSSAPEPEVIPPGDR